MHYIVLIRTNTFKVLIFIKKYSMRLTACVMKLGVDSSFDHE